MSGPQASGAWVASAGPRPAPAQQESLELPIEVFSLVAQFTASVNDLWSFTSTCKSAYAARKDPLTAAGWLVHNAKSPAWALHHAIQAFKEGQHAQAVVEHILKLICASEDRNDIMGVGSDGHFCEVRITSPAAKTAAGGSASKAPHTPPQQAEVQGLVQQQLTTTDLLLTVDKRLREAPLHTAARVGNLPAVKALLVRCVRTNATSSCSISGAASPRHMDGVNSFYSARMLSPRPLSTPRARPASSSSSAITSHALQRTASMQLPSVQAFSPASGGAATPVPTPASSACVPSEVTPEAPGSAAGTWRQSEAATAAFQSPLGEFVSPLFAGPINAGPASSGHEAAPDTQQQALAGGGSLGPPTRLIDSNRPPALQVFAASRPTPLSVLFAPAGNAPSAAAAAAAAAGVSGESSRATSSQEASAVASPLQPPCSAGFATPARQVQVHWAEPESVAGAAADSNDNNNSHAAGAQSSDAAADCASSSFVPTAASSSARSSPLNNMHELLLPLSPADLASPLLSAALELPTGPEVSLSDRRATPLGLAARNGHVHVVQALLAAGADPEASPGVDPSSPGEWFTLHEAVRREGNAQVVRMLLAAGADPNRQSEFPVLAHASVDGDAEMVGVLVAAGADVEARDVYLNRTPLLWAVALGKEESLRVLLAAGAKHDVEDSVANPGQLALHVAANSGTVGVIRVLLEAGADVRARDGEGKTALDLAKRGGCTEAVQLLQAAQQVQHHGHHHHCIIC